MIKRNKNDNSPEQRESNPPDGFIRLDQVYKSYLEAGQLRPVLLGVSAAFGRGETVAILGESGSGKSTILNLISGIDQADSGDIWLDGQKLTGLDDHQRTLFRRHNIGFIFQFMNLVPTLSVWENVILPLELTGMANGKIRQTAESLLEAVGLPDRRDAFPDRLSGGEQQRVAIARALANDPLLVLADEPTGNLDENNGRQVMELLDRLTRQAGKNMILVTHSMQAASYADQILFLKNGILASSTSSIKPQLP